MNAVLWMTVACLAGWLGVGLTMGGRALADVGAGMVGPLVAAGGSWLLISRAFHRDPSGTTTLMSQLFLGKLVFFAVYVVIGIEVLGLTPTAFVVSFATFFLGLHLTEAMLLRRLFAGGVSGRGSGPVS